MEKKGIIGIVLALLVVVFLGVALIGPWYVTSNGGKTDSKFRESTTDGTTTAYDETFYDTNTGKVYRNTFYITIVALVLGIIWLITALLTSMGKLKLSAKIVAIFMLLTMIFAIVAPGYFAATLPGAIKDDSAGVWNKGFIGSGDVTILGVTVTECSWGPGYGWYLAVVAFVVALIGLILVFLKKKAPAVAPAVP